MSGNKSHPGYNVRVYGILQNSKNEVLIIHEKRFGLAMTKFPGGGLEDKEGLSECLKREFQEECGIEVTVGKLFYFNDHYQKSVFDDKQLVFFYFQVTTLHADQELTSALSQKTNNQQRFEWKALENLNPDDFTFPIDRIVVEKLSTKKSA